MNNGVYEGNVLGVARYLADRGNQFIVDVKMPSVFKRIELNRESNIYYSKLKKVTIKPITYRINVFPLEKTVRIVLPERSYGFHLEYASDGGVQTSFFKFQFKQREFYIERIPLEHFTTNITAIDEKIDSEIQAQITDDIYCLFDPQLAVLSTDSCIDEEGKWFFKADSKPIVSFESRYDL